MTLRKMITIIKITTKRNMLTIQKSNYCDDLIKSFLFFVLVCAPKDVFQIIIFFSLCFSSVVIVVCFFVLFLSFFFIKKREQGFRIQFCSSSRVCQVNTKSPPFDQNMAFGIFQNSEEGGRREEVLCTFRPFRPSHKAAELTL